MDWVNGMSHSLCPFLDVEEMCERDSGGREEGREGGGGGVREGEGEGVRDRGIEEDRIIISNNTLYIP